ncbi:uncharacterized protein LOC123427280 [Hordeum vulgare subsp. vulgare]|uniref:uncharacterized protein LOC123427280 n=1 Tax=Hordeum vulgare subsp. vulgare TaxID=112509 RepID=UPI001D1A3681|nr:uncharacterized protein LOC123427280 [Hordeum vulgare subsp. vulgare]
MPSSPERSYGSKVAASPRLFFLFPAPFFFVRVLEGALPWPFGSSKSHGHRMQVLGAVLVGCSAAGNHGSPWDLASLGPPPLPRPEAAIALPALDPPLPAPSPTT